MQGHLNHWGVVLVQGIDSADFLHKQLTQNVLSMQNGECRLFGYCTAQGRLLANGLVVRIHEQSFGLLMHESIIDNIVKRLKMFVLRSKVLIEKSSYMVSGQISMQNQTLPAPKLGLVDTTVLSWSGVGEWAHDHALQNVVLNYPSPLGVKREIYLSDKNQLLIEDDGAFWATWHALDVQLGLFWITARLQELFVPQMIHLEKMGGVDFKKGCYPGQEIIARAQYRGAVKRGLFLGQCDRAIDVKTSVYSLDERFKDKPHGIGEVVDCANRMDRVSMLPLTTCYDVLFVAPLELPDNLTTPVAPNDWQDLRVS